MKRDRQIKPKTLTERFFANEREAVEEIVLTHREGLMVFINTFVKNFDIAEDLASDALAILLVKKPKLRNETYFKTYLFSIGKNLALTYLKKNKNNIPLNENFTLENNENLELLFIQNEEKQLIARAINSLPSEYAEILILRYYENLSIEQICKITHYNKKRIYNLLERSKKSLKNILKREGYEFETD